MDCSGVALISSHVFHLFNLVAAGGQRSKNFYFCKMLHNFVSCLPRFALLDLVVTFEWFQHVMGLICVQELLLKCILCCYLLPCSCVAVSKAWTSFFEAESRTLNS